VLAAQTALVACARDVARRANFSASSYTQLANTVLACPDAAVEAYGHYRAAQDPAAALNHLLRLAYGKDDQDGEHSEASSSEASGAESDEEAEEDDSVSTEAEEEEAAEDELGAAEVDEYEDDYETYGEDSETKSGRAKVQALGRGAGDAHDDDDESSDDSDTEAEVSTEDDDEYEEDFEDSSSADNQTPSPPPGAAARGAALGYRRALPKDKDDEEEEDEGEVRDQEEKAGGSGEYEIGSELAAIVVRLQTTLATLQKHEAFVNHAIGATLDEAKMFLSRGDRDGATECLRRKQVRASQAHTRGTPAAHATS
jgi:hypothetical protein